MATNAVFSSKSIIFLVFLMQKQSKTQKKTFKTQIKTFKTQISEVHIIEITGTL